MKTRALNNEVLYPAEPIVHFTPADAEDLKSRAVQNARRRMRLCAHHSDDNPLQEMIVALASDAYVRPHKHLARTESYHIIEGQADLVLFDDAGKIARVIPLGDYASGKCVFCRLAEPVFHTLVLRTPTLVFHETTNGPFRREETVFAPWSPAESDPQAVAKFMQNLAACASTSVENRS